MQLMDETRMFARIHSFPRDAISAAAAFACRRCIAPPICGALSFLCSMPLRVAKLPASVLFCGTAGDQRKLDAAFRSSLVMCGERGGEQFYS